MKSIIAALTFTFAVSAHAAKILDCNTPVGPDQEVTVISNRDGSLSIVELTSGGSELPARDLSESEWNAKRLILNDGSSVLVKEGRDWIVKDGIDIAPADCD